MTFHDFVPIVLAFLAAAIFTPAVRAMSRRLGFVAQPRPDRWHTKPTALLGGIALILSVSLTYLLVLPRSFSMDLVVGGSAFLGLIGLVDDVRGLKPYQKLVGQLLGAALLIAFDLVLPWTSWAVVNMLITVFWVVGITNAINLLDNMDGLAAGISSIAALSLAASLARGAQVAETVLLLAFAAALFGYLIYNSFPASIFMGDCGSMFLGFFLASSSLLIQAEGRFRGFLPILAVPVLVLAIPIFDVTFVTIARKLAGRSVAQGGRDHTSHRLVALGLSERKAVWVLEGLAIAAGGLAYLMHDLPIDLGVASIGVLLVLLSLFGGYLLGVKVYCDKEVTEAREHKFTAFLVDLSYKRRVFEVFLDMVLIGMAYYIANYLVFGSQDWQPVLDSILRTLPLLVGVKLATFLVMGVYRGMWRYVSMSDLALYAKAVAVSSALCVVALVFLFRFQGLSRAVFVLDALLLLVLLSLSRLAFRLLRRMLPGYTQSHYRRALIYGAGDGGELLLGELRNNPRHDATPVGFADDDPLKKGRVIHGLPVWGGNGTLQEICKNQSIEIVYLSSRKFTDDRVREIYRDCQEVGIELRRVKITIETISLPDHLVPLPISHDHNGDHS